MRTPKKWNSRCKMHGKHTILCTSHQTEKKRTGWGTEITYLQMAVLGKISPEHLLETIGTKYHSLG